MQTLTEHSPLSSLIRIRLPYNFSARRYQVPFYAAMDRGMKRAVLVWHRRAGKEMACWNYLIKETQKRVGAYYYFFPTAVQGRAVLWDGMDKQGRKFLDYIPSELIAGIDGTLMKVTLTNGSIIRVIGTDNYDSKMGTNPIGCVFSEYSLQNPIVWTLIRPILRENGGWAIFNFTPRGENHAYDLWKLAKADPEQWHSSLLTADDTGIISPEDLETERREIIQLHGDDSLYQQEYNCSFTVPIVGAYYANQIGELYRSGRVTNVPYDPIYPVDTYWDIGTADANAIWFGQTVGPTIRLIDYHEAWGVGLPECIQVLQEKGYIYGKHYGPHDIVQKEWTSGKQRIATAGKLGVDFQIVPRLPHLQDGIDMTRAIFRKCWFDQTKCQQGLNALKNYRKKWDEVHKCFLKEPQHDWSSHGADAFRTLGVGFDAAPVERPKGNAERPFPNFLKKRSQFRPLSV